MSFNLIMVNIREEITNILDSISDDETKYFFGPKTSTENIKAKKFYRVIFEETTPKDKTFKGTYHLILPVTITFNVNSKKTDEASMKSIHGISELIDAVLLDSNFRSFPGVNDVALDKMIFAYPFDITRLTQIGSGVRFVFELELKTLC